MIPPTHPQFGSQNPRGGDCDVCLALVRGFLRPRQSAHARARNGQLVWRGRRGRVGDLGGRGIMATSARVDTMISTDA
eukprot:2294751-Pyramimonas_sp.AAC.1